MLRTVVYDLSPAPIRPPLPPSVLGTGITREQVNARIHLHLSRSHRFVTTAASATVQQGARGGGLIRAWLRAELMWDSPTGTTVLARLHDGAGTSLWWDGGAWAVATTEYNPPDTVEANFAALDPEVAPRVGVEWLLTFDPTTALPGTVPSVFGARLAGDLLFAAQRDIPGGARQDGRADSWQDDLLHRVLVPLFESLRPQISDQGVADGSTSVFDYSAGVGDAVADDTPGTRYIVADVEAFYDTDADPDLRSPLAGTFDPVAKTYTLGTPLPDGTEWQALLKFQPHVGMIGNADLFTDQRPAILIDEVEGDQEFGGLAPIHVRTIAAGDALAVPAPKIVTAVARCRIEAEDTVVATNIREALKDRIAGDALVLLSAGTGFTIKVMGPFGPSAERGELDLEGAVPFELELRTVAWYGAAEVVHLLSDGGFTLTYDPAIIGGVFTSPPVGGTVSPPPETGG